MNPKYVIVILVIALIIGYFYYMQKPKYNKGVKAPNFSGTDLNGQPFELKDLRGKYVYLDFWGSWCGPCRALRPHLVQTYRQFHNQKFIDAEGFDIVSVALERQPGRWKSLAKAEGMNWPYQFSTLEEEGQNVVELFGVKSIPSGYLISPEGEILLNRPRMDEITDFLNKKLSN